MQARLSTIAELLSSGRVKVGQSLTYHRRKVGKFYSAIIQHDGTIRTEDGAVHKTLSAAARHFSGRPIDGWIAWKLEGTNTSIGALRLPSTKMNL
jgi:hypothetical protein